MRQQFPFHLAAAHSSPLYPFAAAASKGSARPWRICGVRVWTSDRTIEGVSSEERDIDMPRTSFSSSLSSPKIDFAIDMGNPFLNRTVDGFLKIGAVGASRVAAEETYHVIKKGSISKGTLEGALKRMCKEGAYWGTVAGVYVGMEFGVERTRGTRDWKNAMLAGAITGALISAASNKGGEKVFKDAITGGAVATAAEFINFYT